MLKEALAQLALRLGKKHDLLSLVADGKHHRSDALSSVIVLAGIFFSKEFWWVDSMLSIAVAVLIGKAAIEILSGSIYTLLGRKSEQNVIDIVEKVCRDIMADKNMKLVPHHFHEHRYGQHTELTFHVYIPGNWLIVDGHKIVDEIEKVLRENHHIEATIHIDPEEERNG